MREGVKFSGTLALGRPVSFYARMGQAVGGCPQGVFLCQLMYWTGGVDGHFRGNREDGWIYKVASEIETETSLTLRQQQTAIKKLKELGILQTAVHRVPPDGHTARHFKINMSRLEEVFDQYWEAREREEEEASSEASEEPAETCSISGSAENAFPGLGSAENAFPEVRKTHIQKCGKRTSITTETTAETTDREETEREVESPDVPSGQLQLMKNSWDGDYTRLREYVFDYFLSQGIQSPTIRSSQSEFYGVFDFLMQEQLWWRKRNNACSPKTNYFGFYVKFFQNRYSRENAWMWPYDAFHYTVCLAVGPEEAYRDRVSRTTASRARSTLIEMQEEGICLNEYLQMMVNEFPETSPVDSLQDNKHLRTMLRKAAAIAS